VRRRGAAGRSLPANPPAAVPAVAGKVEVEVIAVIGVVVRPENRCECRAATLMHLPQERPFPRIAMPTLLHTDPPTVGKLEAGNIEGIGVPMLGKAPPPHVVHGPAAVRCRYLDLGDGDAEVALRSGSYRRPHPVLDGRDHRTAQKCRRAQCDAPVEGRRHLERTGSAAMARTTKSSSLHEKLRRANMTGGKALGVLVVPPGFGLRDKAGAERTLAASPEGEQRHRYQRNLELLTRPHGR
jgi:hypothetical protein